MSDAEYMVADLQRTIDELRFRVKWLETHNETLEKRVQWAREDADMCRIAMTKWQMLYEQEKELRSE